MALIVLLFTLCFSWLVDGASQVICPTQTITAVKGSDVFLTAHVKPQADLSMERVDVMRKDPDMMVQSFKYGKNYLVQQSPQYRNTSINSEALSSGNITVRISSLTLNDSGLYRITVFKGKQQHSCAVNLTVVDGSSTSGPPEEDTTKPNDPGASVQTPTWVIGVVLSVVAAVAAGILCWWKFENLRTFVNRCNWSQEAGPKPNNYELQNLNSKPTEEEEDQHTADLKVT
uniref:myelin-oligodendrocyte glycoprotein-like n=1 Tax=Semicossyphus pulcher TaxID=241346 RepID=UPI0037E83C44